MEQLYKVRFVQDRQHWLDGPEVPFRVELALLPFRKLRGVFLLFHERLVEEVLV